VIPAIFEVKKGKNKREAKKIKREMILVKVREGSC
jgi:hypothetical protein